MVTEFGFLVTEFGFLVTEFGFFGYRVWLFGYRVWFLVTEFGFLVTEFGFLVTEFGFLVPWIFGFFLLILFSGYFLVTYFWLPSLVFHRVVLSWVKSIAKVFFMNFYKCLPSFTRFMRLYCFIEQSLSGFSCLEKVVSINRYRVYRVSLGSIRFL